MKKKKIQDSLSSFFSTVWLGMVGLILLTAFFGYISLRDEALSTFPIFFWTMPGIIIAIYLTFTYKSMRAYQFYLFVAMMTASGLGLTMNIVYDILLASKYDGWMVFWLITLAVIAITVLWQFFLGYTFANQLVESSKDIMYGYWDMDSFRVASQEKTHKVQNFLARISPLVPAVVYTFLRSTDETRFPIEELIGPLIMMLVFIILFVRLITNAIVILIWEGKLKNKIHIKRANS